MCPARKAKGLRNSVAGRVGRQKNCPTIQDSAGNRCAPRFHASEGWIRLTGHGGRGLFHKSERAFYFFFFFKTSGPLITSRWHAPSATVLEPVGKQRLFIHEDSLWENPAIRVVHDVVRIVLKGFSPLVWHLYSSNFCWGYRLFVMMEFLQVRFYRDFLFFFFFF